MDLTQFKRLDEVLPIKPVIKVSELVDKTPRTLVYGYTCNRDTFHVYLNKQGEFVRVIYDTYNFMYSNPQVNEELSCADCIPDKRIYPQASDYEFCKLLKDKGHSLPFTTFTESTRNGAFQGLLLAELEIVNRHDLMLAFPVEYQDFFVSDQQLDQSFGYSEGLMQSTLNDLQNMVNAQIEGYLKALKSGKSAEDCYRWISNIKSGAEHYIKGNLESRSLQLEGGSYTDIQLHIEKTLLPRIEQAIADKLAYIRKREALLAVAT